LEADLPPRLILIIAAAGYGKTTTARLLARRWPRSGYCDAGAARNAPEFAEHLLSALNEEEPERSLERADRTIGGGRDSPMMIETARTAWREARPFKSVPVLDHLERALKVRDIHEPGAAR
jgi:hypothetical protein